MRKFYTRVDTRSLSAMRRFLAGHFRYNTMNSWNRSTSYANCVKLHKLDLPEDIQARAWEMLGVDDVYAEINASFREWACAHDWRWQIAWNGRSSGYLVLYQGELQYDKTYTARCNICGRLTWHKESAPCTTEGCSGTLTVLEKPNPRVVTFPGRGLDERGDYEEWSRDVLRERVKLVQDFDKACDQALAIFVGYCRECRVEERTVMVPQKVKVLVAG